MNSLSTVVLFFILATIFPSCSVRSPVEIKQLTDRFIEINADRDRVWFGCFEINPEDHLSLLNFYVKDGVTLHEFFYRRLISTKDCSSQLKSYQILLKDVQRVTLVGITPKYEVEETDKKIESIPEDFSAGHKKLVNWTFIRLQTKRGCESYFSQDCDPENYWGGLIPHKK